MKAAVRRVLLWTFVIGGISFSMGFFGPMIWAPDANQGPLLGLLITGPLGTKGLIGLPQGEGRAAAASVVVAAGLLWYAALGQVPAWFRR
jgi:hypothetical protein